MESTILNFRSEDSVMSVSDAFFTFLFGVGLPSWDVYSDLIFALTLAIPRCNDYKAYLYYEKYHNWSRKYIIFRGIYDKAKIFLKCFYFLEGNCKKEDYFQCPETNKCIWRWHICDADDRDHCGDGSDELYCNGKGIKILSIIKSIY